MSVNKMKADSELHLIVLWEKARYKEKEILDDLGTHLKIIECKSITWTPEKSGNNFTRFYGEYLPNESFKEKECGIGAFLLITVLDEHPEYQFMQTSRGIEYVNRNLFELKTKYRNWTGGGHKIHATNTVRETKHDLILLLGTSYKKYKENMPTQWTGEITTVQQDLIGCNGWNSLKEFFEVLNETVCYLVLRNYEILPGEFRSELHGDIDILTDNYTAIAYIANAVPVFKEPWRVHHFTVINGEQVFFDFRYCGDNYYCLPFEQDLLNSRYQNEEDIYVPSDEYAFYSLVYHALIHKPSIAPDYYDKTATLFEKLDFRKKDKIQETEDPFYMYFSLLQNFMRNRKYFFTRPADVSVFYNKQFAEQGPDDKTIYKYQIGKVDITLDPSAIRQFGNHVEDEILEAARLGRLQEMLDSDIRKEVLYGLSQARESLLSWLPIQKDAHVLEIGCGCGALTGLLCRMANRVSAVEISQRNAEITAWRYADQDNLVIHVGNFMDMRFVEKFDYVIAIGSMGQAGKFFHTETPHRDFLQACKNILAPNGTLVLAIENRLGIKYWAGATEDHTGKMFDGIQGYPSGKQVQTFSRKELQDLLNQTGLPAQDWYYCWPDYKLPLSLESDEYLPARGQMEFWHARAYDQPRVELFSEKQALKSLLTTGLYHEFANSFLVFARTEECVEEDSALWVHETDLRKEKYRIRTEIRKRKDRSRYVLKVAPTPEAVPHLHAIAENCRILSKIYGKQHIAQAKLIADDKLEIEYVEGTTIAELLDHAMERNDMQEFTRWINFFKDNVLRGEDDDMMMPNTVDFHRKDREYEWDLQFGNVLIAPDGHFILYDYEFLVAKMSKRSIFWRVAMEFFAHNAEKAQRCGLDPSKIMQAMNVSDEMMQLYSDWTGKLVQEVFAKHARRYDKPVYRDYQIQCAVPGGV